jgi:hypothetical protein
MNNGGCVNMKKRLLVQCQLSNYDPNGKFILEADSGFQMVMGRAREMMKLLPNLYIDVMLPYDADVITHPYEIYPDLFMSGHMKIIQHEIIPNALATRYDFDLRKIAHCLDLEQNKNNKGMHYDAVYINDPMHLRNFKAMFHLYSGYMPKFIVHSHFVDVPECPKFPVDASLWLGQCEASIKADYNFWQCESAMNQFFDSMGKQFLPHIVDQVKSISSPWDDGYSITEITSPINYGNIRFELKDFFELTQNKTIIFLPNRVGGKGRSSDYTNCGKFMWELLPQLAQSRMKNNKLDFVVIAGNPSQKFSNDELRVECGKHGYIKLDNGPFNRDEFKFIAKQSHITLGLYNQDPYGGTASRECIELGSMPLWLNNFEYSNLIQVSGMSHCLAKPDFSDFVEKLNGLINLARSPGDHQIKNKENLHRIVREKCSYEHTTYDAIMKMGLA